ncbi:hypothetical protein [Bradyrhizobium sp.]|uniref:hypothetical protein n=1 Tax=Bradyrhizobium sp. TaxID=376 RepID=UPI0040378F55
MARYSIRKLGCEYVVLVGDESVLRIASRRKAAKLVVEAAELLSEQSDLPCSPDVDADQIGREVRKVP